MHSPSVNGGREAAPAGPGTRSASPQDDKALGHLSPPPPAALTHLRASNLRGAIVVAECAALTLGAVVLSINASVPVWLVGQLLFALAMVQWFALLHECGHETLFRARRLHVPVGHVAACFSLIPFFNWKRVHGRHHKWTGWQDIDPTTSSLVPRELGRAERLLVNVCWRYWIPLFSVIYRVNNFWNWPRLKTLFQKPDDRRLLAGNMLGLLATYAAVVAIVGFSTVARVVGLALLLTLVAEDLLLLSQHTHVPQNVSGGNPVRPFPTIEQEVFTRSLVFPRWLSALLLHIDAHELHHMYPFVPGYHLSGIPYETDNTIDLWTWIRRARALPGEVFLFQNRLESGADI